MSNVQAPTHPTFLSEIFQLTNSQLNVICFRLAPEVDRKVGNRFSWRFNQKFPNVIVIWHDKYFWALAQPNQSMPSSEQSRKALAEIQADLRKDIGERYYSIQWVSKPQLTASIRAQLAVRILQIRRPFSRPKTIPFENQVEVKREIKFWAETFEIQGVIYPALALTINSVFVFKGNLAEFYENHPYRHDSKKLLLGLKVRDIEKNRSARIINIAGTISERRQELLDYKPGSISTIAINEAPNEQPVVVVQFGKDAKEFHYAMAALRPCVTEETSARFEVEYGKLLKETKIPYQERQNSLTSCKKEATDALAVYGFQLSAKCINNRQYTDLFLPVPFQLEETKLLFGKDTTGKNVVGKRREVLKGLSKGGFIAATRIIAIRQGKFAFRC